MYFQEDDWSLAPCTPPPTELQCELSEWRERQVSQQILLTTPTVLLGDRVRVYRSEGTTQWFTAVIQSYDENSKVRE